MPQSGNMQVEWRAQAYVPSFCQLLGLAATLPLFSSPRCREGAWKIAPPVNVPPCLHGSAYSLFLLIFWSECCSSLSLRLLPSLEFPIIWSNLCSTDFNLQSPSLTVFILFHPQVKIFYPGNFILLILMFFFSFYQKSGIHINYLPSHFPLIACPLVSQQYFCQEPFLFPLRISVLNISEHLPILKVTIWIGRVVCCTSEPSLNVRKIKV